MPTSSTSSRQKANNNNFKNKTSYWQSTNVSAGDKSIINPSTKQANVAGTSSFLKGSSSETSNINRQTSNLVHSKTSNNKYIKHISKPSSLTSTSIALKNSISSLNQNQNNNSNSHHHQNQIDHHLDHNHGHQNQQHTTIPKESIVAVSGLKKSFDLTNKLSILPGGPEDNSEDNINDLDDDIDDNELAGQTLSLSGRLVLTGGANGKHLSSLSLDSMNNDNNFFAGSLSNNNNNNNMAQQNKGSSSILTTSGGKSSFLINNSQFSTSNKNLTKNSSNNNNNAASMNKIMGISQVSLQPPGTTTSSTAQLHSLTASNQNNNHNHHHHHHHHNHQPLSIQRSVSLKYIKTLIILLMAVDLLITVFVHQFSIQDQLNLSFIVSFKMRFSLLNLILSTVWYIILIGAILFEFYYILVISCFVDCISFITLLVCSIIHFSRRIDYNSVQLTYLLALLFSIVVLHVYLIVFGCLMVYLTMAIKRRRIGNGQQRP